MKNDTTGTSATTGTSPSSSSPLRLYDVSNPSAIADEIGSLRAEAKSLADAIRVLEDLLEMTGQDAVDGDLFRVAISRNVQTTTIDWKAIATKLQPSRQLVTAHTTVKTSARPRFRVSALKKGA